MQTPAAGAYDAPGPAPQAGDPYGVRRDIERCRQDETRPGARPRPAEGGRKIDEPRRIAQMDAGEAGAAFDMRGARLQAGREKRDGAAKSPDVALSSRRKNWPPESTRSLQARPHASGR